MPTAFPPVGISLVVIHDDDDGYDDNEATGEGADNEDDENDGASQTPKTPSECQCCKPKICYVDIFFIAYDTNVSLKGPVLFGQCKSHPENMDGSDNKHYLDNFKTVYQTVSILTGWHKYILNSLNVGTVSIMFLCFRYCPDGFILSRWFLLPSGRF